MKKLLSLLVLVSSIASAQTRIVHKFVKVGVGFTYQADNGASVAPQQVTQSNVNPEGDVLRIFFNNAWYINILSQDSIVINGTGTTGTLAAKRNLLLTDVFPSLTPGGGGSGSATSVSADSITETSTKKVLTSTERTKLAATIDSIRAKKIVSDSITASSIVFSSSNFSGAGTVASPLTVIGGGGTSDSIRVAASNPSTGNVYINSVDKKLYYLIGGYWHRVGILDSTISNSAPVASSVALVGNDTVGRTRSTTYTYSDAESNTEGSTVKKYYTYTNTSGAGSSLVATASTYVIARTDTGKYIRSSVTPYATTGTSPGTEVFSGYSGVIKDSATSGGVSLANLTLSSSSGTVTESPTGTFTATTTATGIFNQSLPASTAGYIQMDVSSITAGSVLAFDLQNSVEGFAGLGYGVFHLSGTYYRCENGTLTNTTVTATNGDKCRVKRTGSTITAEYTTNGTTWTTLYTFSATTSAQLYSKFDITGTSFSILNPKGSGVL